MPPAREERKHLGQHHGEAAWLVWETPRGRRLVSSGLFIPDVALSGVSGSHL